MRHVRQREVVTRREADHPTLAVAGVDAEQFIVDVVGGGGASGNSDAKSFWNTKVVS